MTLFLDFGVGLIGLGGEGGGEDGGKGVMYLDYLGCKHGFWDIFDHDGGSWKDFYDSRKWLNKYYNSEIPIMLENFKVLYTRSNLAVITK